MKILEVFIKSKSFNVEECEDSFFISDDFIAVIDGATSKTSIQYGHESSGRFSSRIICKSIQQLPKEISCVEAIEFITKELYDKYINLGLETLLKDEPQNRATSSVIIYSNYQKEVWIVGDCQCIVDGEVYNNKKLVDVYLSDIRSLFLHCELARGISYKNLQENDSGRSYILPLLKDQFLFQNSLIDSLYSYGAIDGFTVPKEKIVIINADASKSIVLASDGYPEIFDTLKMSEDYLNFILSKDPLCINEFKSTKGLKPGNASFDDRCYVKFINAI